MWIGLKSATESGDSDKIMALEIEAKLRVDSHDVVREALSDHGAISVGNVVETNHIYDRPDGSLRSRGCALRLRTAVSDNGESCPATLTVKGPAMSGPLKSREEIEIRIERPDDGRRMLALMGFEEVMRFAKRRESWSLDGCRVELDTLPLIGTFVEIEGQDVEAVSRVQQRLGLGSLTHIPTSYIGLLRSYCEANDIDWRRIEF